MHIIVWCRLSKNDNENIMAMCFTIPVGSSIQGIPTSQNLIESDACDMHMLEYVESLNIKSTMYTCMRHLEKQTNRQKGHMDRIQEIIYF